MAHPPSAAVVGSLNTDLIARANVMPGPGETVFGNSFSVGFGGKGANQAVIFRKLGGETTFVGAVGHDSFGKDYVNYLQEVGIETDTVQSEPTSTGCAPIWVEEKTGENRIIVVPGANALVSPNRVQAAVAGLSIDTKHAFAVICQNEINMEATVAALEAGSKAGALTILTPAPVPAAGLPPSVLACVSVLVPNIHEAPQLAAQLGKEVSATDAVQKGTQAGSALLAAGCKAVVVTLGSNGCLVLLAGHEPVHVPGVPVSTVVDTTGAGDAFSGSLAYFTLLLSVAAVAPGAPHTPSLDVLVEAAGRACYVAADSVTRKGTQSSYPSKEQLPACLFDSSARGAGLQAAKERPL